MAILVKKSSKVSFLSQKILAGLLAANCYTLITLTTQGQKYEGVYSAENALP